MFSIAPLTSLSTMTPQADPDPVASFRQLIALPPYTARSSIAASVYLTKPIQQAAHA
jgi:hypothetical protein